MQSQTPNSPDTFADSPSDHSQNSSLNASPVRPGVERGESSGRRPRNTKNLFINTTGINTKQAARTTLGTSSLAHVAESSTASLPATIDTQNAPTAIPGHVLPTSSGQGAGHAFSAPASPSAYVPSMPLQRRSKLGLTINTVDPESAEANHAVPSTPLRQAPMALRMRSSDLSNRLGTVPEGSGAPPLSSMRETQDSGEMLFSPSVAPHGGMQLPPIRSNADPSLPTPGFGVEGGMKFSRPGSSSTSSPAARTSRPALNLAHPAFDAPGSSTVVQHTVSHIPQTPQHELPLSREAKSPGYPDGPICIYPPSVYLYHQPTQVEAREFDVIINVAKEVENPFLALEKDVSAADSSTPTSRYRDAGIQCTIIGGASEVSEDTDNVEPSSAVSDKTFTSAFEKMPEDEPETPRAAAPKAKADPEYIHLPWEHNSKVYDEWLRVCEIIDDRVRKGLRVLIHCQLGVSRSASLVVAYGIFKNPRLTPDEAREQAKCRSRYIDLNMHFMYELGDFRKLLADRYPEAAAAQAQPAHSLRRGPVGAPLTRTKTDSVLISSNHAMVDGLPSVDERGSHRREDATARRASTPNQGEPHMDAFFGASSDVPATAPLRASWSPTADIDELPEMSRPSEERPAEPLMHDDSRQSTPKAIPARIDSSQDLPVPPLPPQRPAPLPPIDAGRSLHFDEPTPPRTAEKQDVRPVPILPPEDASRALPSAAPIPVENSAQNTATLPPPNLFHLPIRPRASNSPPNSARRSLRPMPSLPAGFNSTIRSRRLLQPASPTPPPAVPPLPLHFQGMQPSLGLDTAVLDDSEAGNGSNDLMSPRAVEFTANPFHAHRSSAGDLALPIIVPPQSRRPVEEDPRSAHVVGGAPIVRAIDDVLD